VGDASLIADEVRDGIAPRAFAHWRRFRRKAKSAGNLTIINFLSTWLGHD
jgi:hypothetical protein